MYLVYVERDGAPFTTRTSSGLQDSSFSRLVMMRFQRHFTWFSVNEHGRRPTLIDFIIVIVFRFSFFGCKHGRMADLC